MAPNPNRHFGTTWTFPTHSGAREFVSLDVANYKADQDANRLQELSELCRSQREDLSGKLAHQAEMLAEALKAKNDALERLQEIRDCIPIAHLSLDLGASVARWKVAYGKMAEELASLRPSAPRFHLMQVVICNRNGFESAFRIRHLKYDASARSWLYTNSWNDGVAPLGAGMWAPEVNLRALTTEEKE